MRASVEECAATAKRIPVSESRAMCASLLQAIAKRVRLKPDRG